MAPSIFAVRFCVLATLVLHALPALASLYPTKPIASTVFTAGMPAEVRWMEDGKRPLLNATGDVEIDLYAGNNTYLAKIGKGINPLSLSTTVFIPPKVIPANYHLYTLHFITTEPPQTIYTADFSIIPDSFSASSSSVSPPSSVTTVTSTAFSRVIGMQTPQPSSTQKANAGLGMSWGFGGRTDRGGSFGMDVEKMKFRLVFIVWPALVGLSMAL
ncbi:hypothetical protein BDZ97DRAFT_2078618 [Flammula alnicola]|nr:hypothetical protein BDZ97DRAFT_2078618 [Flammula alnicola]